MTRLPVDVFENLSFFLAQWATQQQYISWYVGWESLPFIDILVAFIAIYVDRGTENEKKLRLTESIMLYSELGDFCPD